MTLAEAVRGSNTIEGYRVSRDDALLAIDDQDPIEAADDAIAWEATTASRRAMTYVLQQHDDPHFRHSVATIRSLHFMLVDYDLDALPGRWRPGPIFVQDSATAEIVYEGPDADDVPGLMDELASSLQDDEGSVLVRAAMAHLNTVMVHPFKDGNGRIARALQSLVLAREGILAPQFCSIEEYLGRFTRDFCAVLSEVGGGHWAPDRDALPWVRFCLTAHFRQANALLHRIDQMGRLWELVDRELQQAGLPDRMAEPLFLAAWGYSLRNETYRSRAEITAATASRDLRALVDVGLLAAHGEKRGRHYTASTSLSAAAERARVAITAGRSADPYSDPEGMADPYRQATLFDPRQP